MEEIIDNINGNDEIKRISRKVIAAERITDAEALTLFTDAPLALLGALATTVRERINGRNVYYNRNFHIEPTNICLFNCKFCSYRRPADSPEAWYYSLDEVAEIARRYVGSGVTEAHIVGGVHPKHDLQYYAEMVRRVKAVLPDVAIKAYTAVELHYIICKAGVELEDGLRMLKECGMEAIPGGGAEIFDPEIRTQICGDKSTAEEWLDTHRAAHRVGLSTNATILYGHVENYGHRVDHLSRLRRLQDETGGFSAFIPLKYRNMHNSMSEIGEVSIVEDMRMLAISRIYLDNVPHIKAYWVMYGKATTEMALAFGADDIDGTIDDTTKIYSMAGAEDEKPRMSAGEMQAMIRQAGYVPVERDTHYHEVLRKM